MITLIQTPAWGETHFVPTTRTVVDASCPIDGTPLLSRMEHADYSYDCKGCGASYQWGNTDPDSLRSQARQYVTRVAQNLADGFVLLRDAPRAQRVVTAARERGLLEERLH